MNTNLRSLYDVPRDGTEIELGHINGQWDVAHWSRKLRRWVYRVDKERGMPVTWRPLETSSR